MRTTLMRVPATRGLPAKVSGVETIADLIEHSWHALAIVTIASTTPQEPQLNICATA
jgi:hypothetical protein